MNNFIFRHIIKPFAGRWLKGVFLLLIWTIAFIALPAISGWFLASCSLAFITANALFSYLMPSAIIRLLALLRTATRYFERLENHKTTLDAQRSLQLKIFHAVARFPYFKKQVNNNSSILENSTYGIDLILNHILLWFLPFSALIVSLVIYFFFLNVFSTEIALEFLISSAVLLFVIPQYILFKNRKLYAKLKLQREANNQALIQSFRGRIEIVKYNLEEKAINQQKNSMTQIEQLESKLQINSFALQMIIGFGFSCIAIFILWNSNNYDISAPLAIGIFFGIMAQAELSEMLFSGKSEKSSVAHQIKDINTIIQQEDATQENVRVNSTFKRLILNDISGKIPETSVITNSIRLEIKKGEWVALYGETGKGKTTILNSLFYPEYRHQGSLIWNDDTEISHLPIPECIYVTQKAYLLTGTLRENFEGYHDEEIVPVLKTVDLTSWYLALQNGLDTWLGENGETLSGGQRKKLLLAQALLKKPKFLIVDEPTAGISIENAFDVFRNIKCTYPEMSLLMATHQNAFGSEVDKLVRL
ncbi:MAG: ATP-binding cassette domain-containing protein [Bacteroidota bacterium]|nr:ATP-binding cassette domain-containing protein [Bacteroidota bacterium]